MSLTTTTTNFTDSAVKSFPNLTQLVGEIEAPFFKDSEFIAKVQQSKREVVTEALAQIEADPVTISKTKDQFMKYVFANLEQETMKMYVLELLEVGSIKEFLSSQLEPFLTLDRGKSLKEFIDFAIEEFKKNEIDVGDDDVENKELSNSGGGVGSGLSSLSSVLKVVNPENFNSSTTDTSANQINAPTQDVSTQADISKTIQKLILPSLGSGVNQFNMNTEVYKIVYRDPLVEFMASNDMKTFMKSLFDDMKPQMRSILETAMLPINLQWLLLKAAVDKWKSAPAITTGLSLDKWLEKTKGDSYNNIGGNKGRKRRHRTPRGRVKGRRTRRKEYQ
jgi:hypothetical protein